MKGARVRPLVSSHRAGAAPHGWLHDAVPQDRGLLLAHISTGAEDVARIAGAMLAIERVRAFRQLVVDISATGDGKDALAELAEGVPVLRVASRAEPLRDRLGAGGAVAALLYSDGSAALEAAIATVRADVSLVYVGRSPDVRTSGQAIARLADLLLLTDAGGAPLRGVARERIHAIANPLLELMRRHAAEAMSRASWRRYGVKAGGYVLAVLDGPPAADAADQVAALAGGTPVVLLPADATFLERLSLERGAAAIASSSPRAREEAAALGIEYRPLAPDAAPVSHQGARVCVELGNVLMANFVRVRVA